MPAPRRRILVLVVLCAAFGLSGCANGQFEMDPAYWFPDNKKKLPGERREVFPGGVPGVTQGVPQELHRGNQAAQEQALAPVQQDQQQQAEERPKPRPKKVARPRPAPAPEQEEQAQPAQRAAQPAPRAAQPAPGGGAWPAPQQQAQPQQQQQQAPAAGAWPAPPASGTFTR